MNIAPQATYRARLSLLAAVIAGVLVASASATLAVSDVIDGCSEYCTTGACPNPPLNCRLATSGKCKLTANISCDHTGATIQLVNGTDIDLQGYDITCTETGSNTCNYTAITMNTSASKVTSSAGGSVISGPFQTGIDCGLNTSSIVEDITVNDGIYAIKDCQTVRNNVIGTSTQYNGFGINEGISTQGISNTDSFTENYIEGRILPIWSASSHSLDIQHNVLKGTGSTAFTLGSGQSSSEGTAKFNIIFNYITASTIFATPGTDHVAYDGNFCDSAISGCSTCIAAGRCMEYASPFTGN